MTDFPECAECGHVVGAHFHPDPPWLTAAVAAAYELWGSHPRRVILAALPILRAGIEADYLARRDAADLAAGRITVTTTRCDCGTPPVHSTGVHP